MTLYLNCILAGKQCSPYHVEHGSVTIQGAGVGAIATASCDEDFYLIGDMERQCLLSNNWSGIPAKCASMLQLQSKTV